MESFKNEHPTSKVLATKLITTTSFNKVKSELSWLAGAIGWLRYQVHTSEDVQILVQGDGL